VLIIGSFLGYLTSAYLSRRCWSGISARPCPGEVIGVFAGGAYMIVVIAALMLPETKGKTLVAFG
jgi:hypothetical protein